MKYKIGKDEKKYFFILFLFFFILCFLTPLSNDDWENFLILGNSPIKYAFNKYFTWEGRIISRIIIVFLTYRKWMWNIISSLVTTSIIYFIMKIINPKNKKATLLLIFLTFLLMSFKVFTQTLIWVTGNITYVFIQNVKYYTDMYGNPDEILTCDGFYVYVYNKNVVAEKFT